ncbi:MAG: phosphoserine phosphatase [Candidatus Methanoperedenaceae archaeon HGW-Methanoperedenaceae-1]|jgi:uncharacterized coiled-coil DUF342 family protein|nr:MAG: phosphoserine phosphatase [Candidatus Methanoperedenaceae archaeon HGW-Methanoperedenaceae-1]
MENTHAEPQKTPVYDGSDEITIKVPKLPERELKEKTNQLRQRLDKNERELKNIFREISLHNEGGQDLKAKRDGINGRVRELSKKASELRIKRDEANKQIAGLKSLRDEFRKTSQDAGEKIGALKKTRDELNKTARGRVETLDKAYSEELDKFVNADIPLEYEIDLFNRLIELGQRLEATKKANEIHVEMSQEYTKSKVVYSDMDSVYEQIRAFSDESQKYHEGMIALYNEMDTLRKEADAYHAQLSEKYKCISPLRGRIDGLKSDSLRIKEELDAYLEQGKEIQLAKDERKNEEKRVEAKDKFKKTGRLSLDELRILVENEDIKL